VYIKSHSGGMPKCGWRFRVGNDTDDIGVVHNVEEAQASEGVNG